MHEFEFKFAKEGIDATGETFYAVTRYGEALKAKAITLSLIDCHAFAGRDELLRLRWPLG